MQFAHVRALLLALLARMARTRRSRSTPSAPSTTRRCRRATRTSPANCAASSARTRPSPTRTRRSRGDLRREVREMIAAGKTDDEIRTFMIERYGDFVLYKPRMTAGNFLLWAAPVLLLAFGAFAVVRVVRQQVRRGRHRSERPGGRQIVTPFHPDLRRHARGGDCVRGCAAAAKRSVCGQGCSLPCPARPRSLVALVIALPVAAAALYSRISNFPWDNPIAAAAVPPGHGEGAAGGDMNEVKAQLEARLAANPSDLEGWRMLGRTYLVTGEAAKAVAAYQKAIDADRRQGPGAQARPRRGTRFSPTIRRCRTRQRQIVDAALAADASNGRPVVLGRDGDPAGDKETAKARWTQAARAEPAGGHPPDSRRAARGTRCRGACVAAAPPPAMGAAGRHGRCNGSRCSHGRCRGRPGAHRAARFASQSRSIRRSRARCSRARRCSSRRASPAFPGPPLAAVRLTSGRVADDRGAERRQLDDRGPQPLVGQ